MRTALHAEWTKLRTLASPLWLLIGTVAVTVGLSAVAASVVTCTDGSCGSDPTRISLVGVALGQALVAILAVLVISNEYGTGMIRTTLTAVPRRTAVFAAKCVVVGGVVAVGGSVAVLGALFAGRMVQADPGGRALSLSEGPTLRAVVGSVIYLILIALLSLGVATAVRDSAASIGVVLGVLYVFPVIAATISNARLQHVLEQIAPMSAGLAVQATTHLDRLPIGPWAGLGVTVGWAAAALLLGGLLLGRRDA